MIRKIVGLTALVAATLGGGQAGQVDAYHHGKPHCPDSNGSALGGSVYFNYSTKYYWCDVNPPQRLHLTNTPSNLACLNAGGHGWTWTYRICWDVDY
jgi:hypothetical protein